MLHHCGQLLVAEDRKHRHAGRFSQRFSQTAQLGKDLEVGLVEHLLPIDRVAMAAIGWRMPVCAQAQRLGQRAWALGDLDADCPRRVGPSGDELPVDSHNAVALAEVVEAALLGLRVQRGDGEKNGSSWWMP